MGVFLFVMANIRIAARARLAPIGLTVTLGLGLFLWARRWAGDVPPPGAGPLCLVATVLAHGRYVTTDVAAALGVTLAGGSFSRFLAAPPGLPVMAGLALGTASSASSPPCSSCRCGPAGGAGSSSNPDGVRDTWPAWG